MPILRAGLGMLEGMTKLLPTAEVGFLGLVRDEQTFKPTTYAERLPDNLAGRQCFALDPMLATGGPTTQQVSPCSAAATIAASRLSTTSAPSAEKSL